MHGNPNINLKKYVFWTGTGGKQQVVKHDRSAVIQELSCNSNKPWNLVVNICTTFFKMSNFSILQTRYIHLFHSIFKICSDSSPEHHYYLALHEGVVFCLVGIIRGFLNSLCRYSQIKSSRLSHFHRFPHTEILSQNANSFLGC